MISHPLIPQPIFRPLKEAIAIRRYRVLRGRVWGIVGNDFNKWTPHNAKVVFRNGYHQRQRELAWRMLSIYRKARLKNMP